MNSIFPFMRVTVIFTLCCIAVIFLTNFSGFFKSYKDDPDWKEPYSAKVKSDAGGAAAGSSIVGPGAVVFNAKCAACHQSSGKGMPGIYPPLVGSEFAQHKDVTIPIRIVLHGYQGKIQRAGKEYNGVMTPWKDALSDEEIAQVLTSVRSGWGNNAPAIDPKDVAAIRAKTVTRGTSYTEAELLKPL
jgi:mono/diheme cytochrome c family protein